MASTRDLWLESFPEDEIPAFPCPRCDRGNLRYIEKSRRFEESEGSKIAQQSGDISPFEAEWRFSIFLKCGVFKCGNIVSVQGDAELKERHDWEIDQDRFYYLLTPRGMYPPPPLATIPSETPQSVSDEIRIAFSLFWIDLGSCANRLRISVEKILDELGAPKGKLFDRIQAFKTSDPDLADTFDALRHVGNVGSHEGAVKREATLDAFEIYQDTLADLFGNRKAKIAAMRQRLIQTKGKY
jgi:hypothetical protein